MRTSWAEGRPTLGGGREEVEQMKRGIEHEEECGKRSKKSVCYFSGVDLLSVDREKKLRLALLQLDPI